MPPLIVQPLVENAVKHGISAKSAGGEVAIVARVNETREQGRQFSIVVRDTGVGSL
jgi:sensor histidine kinase YesM